VDSTRDRARVDRWKEVDRWQEVEQWQDLDPWQESLERSRARRGKSMQDSRPVGHARARRSTGKQRLKRIRNATTIAALALIAAILASALGGGGSEASPPAAKADAPRAASARPQKTPAPKPPGWRDCPLAVAPAGYVNPLARAIVKPERVDQGVDYAGVGKLAAIGAGRVTYVGTSNTGWPGAFIQYQLLDGADAGCYVYYAEGVVPAEGLRVGDTISAGQLIATIIPMFPTGIEIGWGAGIRTKAYAKVAGQWSPTADEDNIATAAGKSFSSLIAALGGPPGKIEG
jgi:murein DD-endopeptidase MepM/ murein hydrolase activator NlpD